MTLCMTRREITLVEVVWRGRGHVTLRMIRREITLVEVVLRGERFEQPSRPDLWECRS